MGIEPTSKAWEAFVLPLNYTRDERILRQPAAIRLKWKRVKGLCPARIASAVRPSPEVTLIDFSGAPCRMGDPASNE